MDEQKLVTLCKRGDRKALQSLYERYAPWMMGISMRYAGDKESSRDILHDSFVKIFGSIERFEYRGVGSLKAWIGRIVVNTALDFLRSYGNFSSSDELETLAVPDGDRNDDEEEIQFYESVSDDTIVYCIGRLPVRLRTVFNLFMFEDMPHQDIAQKLGISEAASRVRLHRAKALLAEALTEHKARI